MTERLSQLLHDEATGLTPPPPDAAAILERGRGLRRRQRITTGAAAFAVAAVVVTTAGFVAMQTGDPGTRELGPTTGTGSKPTIVYGNGSDVVLGDEVVQVPGTVHSFHYTSLGVLVRSNPNDGASDGSGPETLTLVGYDGATTTDLGTIPEGVGPATDPAQGIYVLAEARGDGFVAVVRDSASGDLLNEVPLPDLPKSYWEVPPLSLDGQTLYVGYENETAAVDLETGEHTIVSGMAGGLPEVRGGHTTIQGRGSIQVIDVATGEALLDVETRGYAWGTLSPDGRYLRLDRDGMKPQPTEFYDLSSGSVQELDASYAWGWTADGGLFRVDADGVTSCDLGTGECETSPSAVPVPEDAFVHVGGRVYES